jgi:16S rRNA (cytidine1402-2'-O)-methyltransferase
VTGTGHGRLRVVGTPIGNLADLSPRASAALADADVIACEDTRRTGRLLSFAGIAHGRLVVVNEQTERSATPRLVDAALGGESVVLVSDAGMPAISDPGHVLVAAAIAAGVEVEVVPGPSAVLVALVASGLAADRFCFEGFLPRKGAERARRLAAVATEPRTSVLFEAPHRIARTLADLRDAVGPDRPVTVARELTKLHEEVWRTSLGEAAAVAVLAEARGEHVVVLGGAPPAEVGDDEVTAALRTHLDAGATRRDAVDAVVAELGVARKRAYALALPLA